MVQLCFGPFFFVNFIFFSLQHDSSYANLTRHTALKDKMNKTFLTKNLDCETNRISSLDSDMLLEK